MEPTSIVWWKCRMAEIYTGKTGKYEKADKY